MEYQARNRSIHAFQFTGPESIPALQAFMAPASPGYDGAAQSVHIIAIDRNAMKNWPTLGRQFTDVTTAAGAWIVKEEDGFTVMTDEEMRRHFDVPEPPEEPEVAPAEAAPASVPEIIDL